MSHSRLPTLKGRRGRPPKDPSVTVESVLAEVLQNRDFAANPILGLAIVAQNEHSKRAFHNTSTYLEAIEVLAEAVDQDDARDLGARPMELCNCGHLRARHRGDGYCVACLYRLQDTGWHGCKAFQARPELPEASCVCACGASRIGYKGRAQDPHLPRVHQSAELGGCYELVHVPRTAKRLGAVPIASRAKRGDM